MNIKTLKKIQKGRTWFLNQKIKKSGKNNFQKFSYFELKDIVPFHRQICDDLKIEAWYELTHEYAYLYIFDLEQDDGQEAVKFSFPIRKESSSGKVTKDMQDDGAIQTYTKRYLYVQLWDISDADAIDSKNNALERVPPEKSKKVIKEIGDELFKQHISNPTKQDWINGLECKLKRKEVTIPEYNEAKRMIESR